MPRAIGVLNVPKTVLIPHPRTVRKDKVIARDGASASLRMDAAVCWDVRHQTGIEYAGRGIRVNGVAGFRDREVLHVGGGASAGRG